MANDDNPVYDRTLVWATHKDIEQAAVMPRSALDRPTFPSGWTEVTRQEPESNKKVQAALDAGTAPPPGGSDITATADLQDADVAYPASTTPAAAAVKGN